jgi:hypothetical protein
VSERIVHEMKWFRTIGGKTYRFMAQQGRLDNGDMYQTVKVWRTNQMTYARPLRFFSRVVKNG